MKKFISITLTLIIITGTGTFAEESQTPETQKQIVTIITKDGSEIIGTIETETEEAYNIKTPSGIAMEVPKSMIVKMSEFEGKVEKGKLFHPDPNKSMYLFSPSAFPIDKGKKYCRDFCVFFPSLNLGVTESISVQAGAFWFPGMSLENTPLVGSLKFTFLQAEKLAFAGGAMYIRFPDFGDDFSTGTGFTFVTGTFGDRFTHGSVSAGWGFIQFEGKWEFMDRPIIVLAGNKRISNTMAVITENWFLPEFGFDMSPLSLSVRFFGRQIAVDIGGAFVLKMLEEGILPIPILNFTYHFK